MSLLSMLHETNSVQDLSKPPLRVSTLPTVIHPAADTSFALMDGRPVLFSEANQKIYELDRVGAYIWCKLQEQETTIETVLDGLAGFGIERSKARQFVR